MIDHTGHPHPSTPKARALCRANGGTGFIGKIGPDVPVAKKGDNDKPAPRKQPHVVDVAPKAPPKPPATQKGPTVPKDHGTPKPPTPPSKPASPKAPTAKPVGERDITPKNFDKSTMQIKDGNGNWRTVDSFTKAPGGGSRSAGGRGGQYTFRDADGKVIRSASPNEKITVRNIPDLKTPTPLPPPPSVPKQDIARAMQVYVPPADSSLTLGQAKIQNAMRSGASRDFIVARSSMSPEETNRVIDMILKKYNVPNNIYPRQGSGGKPPVAKEVKKTPPPKPNGLGWGDVETPGGPPSPALDSAIGRVSVDQRVEKNVHRVLAIQESQVGNKVKLIRSVKSNLSTQPGPGIKKAQSESTMAVCTHDGHISLHTHLHDKQGLIAKAMESGWFSQGGTNGVDQVIAHEMGHALMMEFDMTPDQRRLMVNSMIEIFGLTPVPISNWYSGVIGQIISKNPSNKRKLQRAVSKYGSTNINEFIAEVWSEYTMNPKPRPKVQRMGDVLKKIISERAVR